MSGTKVTLQAPCSKCGGNEFWDNRLTKTGKQPSYRCVKCKNGVWEASKEGTSNNVAPIVKKQAPKTYTPKSNTISASYYGAWAATLAITAVEQKLDKELLAKTFAYFMEKVEKAVNKEVGGITKPTTEPVENTVVENEEPEAKVDLGDDLDLGSLDLSDLGSLEV